MKGGIIHHQYGIRLWISTAVNQHGRLETCGALRNKKPVICIVSGLAFYLLFRWDLTSEPFPGFSKRAK
jgi:Centromere DNA-binding protein complex CBF3 subunit, domain 2